MTAGVAALRIRRMRATDLEQVMAIAASLRDAPQWPRAAYLSALDTDSTPRRIALVAEESGSGALTGFAVASFLPPQAELETIAVLAADQRRRIGRKLFFVLVDELRASATSEFLLEVRASNQKALGFYRSLGWIEAGRRPRYYADPEEDAVLMSLALG
jgi:[ribosomal protein S18]-alanine N-acetyltransferase